MSNSADPPVPDEYPLRTEDLLARLPPGLTETAGASDGVSTTAPPATFRRRRPARGSFWALLGCNAIVFVASICIMVIELTASRLIAAHLGASLYTWTSVIGVVLAGISFGNFLGGWLADRYQASRLLSWLFVVAGLLSFSILWVNEWAAGQPRPDGLSWPVWISFVVAWIFLLPALSLGTISPVAASLAVQQSSRTGITLGNVYAWGAMGSIVGTFLAGFFLIDHLGTRMIIVLTSLTLLSMGILVAAGQWVFRAAVLFGLMQFVALIGVCASIDGSAEADEPDAGGLWPFAEQAAEDEQPGLSWRRRIARPLHEIGLLLKIRRDNPDEYNDESNYFAIHIGTDVQDGEPVKELKLDHLLHSYYSPRNPTRLYYEYEQVYAEVTERAAAGWDRITTAKLSTPPVDERFAALLPARVTYDSAGQTLSVRGALGEWQMRKLLKIGPYADFWQALWEIHTQSQSDTGFVSVPLESLPKGLEFPEEANDRIYYDATLGALISRSRLSFDDVLELMASGDHAGYVEAVAELSRKSRSVRTMFIGGGGFVFPRWIDAMFPGEAVIDVAEIDPAVKLAVQRELGLPPDDQTRVRTHIGDARQFVQDQVRRNIERQAAGQPPEFYDFIYGDAFNDFSVPWHLTTLEFTRHVRNLLDPRQGVLLTNIIDIYPRTVSLAKPVDGKPLTKLPAAFLPKKLQPENWTAVPKFPGLQVQVSKTGAYRLGVRGKMSVETRDRLQGLAGDHPVLRHIIDDLQQRSQKEAAGAFLGRYVQTVREVFPYVYLFSGDQGEPGDDRDTFVVACSLKRLDFSERGARSRFWRGKPFAWCELTSDGHLVDSGEMPAVLELSGGELLTDDFAPVDNLLAPVFTRQ